MSNIHIIAEAGTNHNGKVDKAKKLSLIAKEAGANSVKFQIINTWKLYLPGQYEYGKYNIDDIIKIRLEGELADRDYIEINNYCNELNLLFSASVFDVDGLNLLNSLNPPYIKIASCDINNFKFLRQVVATQKKMIISTGMATQQEIENTLTLLFKEGFNDIVLMHCISEYPAFLDKMNLSYLDTLKKFGYPLGLSDHTGNSIAACVALAKGVTWFEKHFTEDRNQKGLDHAYAMEKDSLSQYIKDIHDTEKTLLVNQSKVTDEEKITAKRARRALYAARDIKAGEILKDEDILIVRPQGPMSADQYDLIINKSIKKKINKYQPFTFDHF